MAVISGLIVMAIGALFIRWARTRSENRLYRVLVARSMVLRKTEDGAHSFYRTAGLGMIVAGVLIIIRG